MNGVVAKASEAIYEASRDTDALPMCESIRFARAALEAALGPQFEGTVCFESTDWDWWLKLAPEVKGRAVAAFRQAVDAELLASRPAFFTPASAQITIVGNTPTTGGAA